MTRSIAYLALAALIACGGSQAPEDDAPSDPPEERPAQPEMTEEERVLAAHMARQGEACEAMCARLTECAIEDTEKHAPEELEGVDLEALARQHRKSCEGPCKDAEISVRQVETIEDCNEAGKSCEAYLDCLDAAQPEPDTGEAPGAADDDVE